MLKNQCIFLAIFQHSLNEKKRKEFDLKTFTTHEVGIMISQLHDHNLITTQRSLYKIDLDNAEILAENQVMRMETSWMRIMLETNTKMLEILTNKMESVLDQIAGNNDDINRRKDGLRDITPKSGGAIREALQNMDSEVKTSLDQIKAKIGATTASHLDPTTEAGYPPLLKTDFAKAVKSHQTAGNSSGEPKNIPEREPTKKTVFFFKEKTENDIAKIGWRKVENQPRAHKSATKIRLEKEKNDKEKKRAEKEVIMCGIPSLRIDQPDYRRDMESIMEVFAELSPTRLGTGEGIRVKGKHIVTATRQLKHGDTEKLPFTILFKDKAIAHKVRSAAIKAGIWNRRKPKEPEKGTKKAPDKAPPITYIHAAHTSLERAKFRAQKEFKKTPDGQEAKVFKTLERSNRYNLADYVDKEEEEATIIDDKGTVNDDELTDAADADGNELLFTTPISSPP